MMITSRNVSVGHGEQSGSVQTVNVTQTTALAITLTDNTTSYIEATISARKSGGVDHAAYIRGALVRRDGGGAATIVGAVQTPVTIETAGAAAWDVTITVSGNDARVSVTGAAATTIDWQVYVRVTFFK